MSAPTVDRPLRAVVGRPRRRRRGLLVALAVLLAVGAGWLVWASPVLAVKTVRVADVDGRELDAATMREVLAVAQVRVGVPLVRIDADGAQARVAALPWVAGVEVRRGWPNEVVVAVTARTALARSPDGRGIDANGVVFDSAKTADRKLPTVDATGDGQVAAMDVLGSLPPEFARRVVSVHATSLDDVELRLRSGDLVRWGSAEDPELKAGVLTALMRHKADMYDVSAPGLPTTYRAP